MAIQLYPFQIKVVEDALTLPRPLAYWNRTETGLGKSIMTAETLARLGSKQILIVAPSSSKLQWVDVIHEHLPHLSIGVISMGRNRKNLSKPEAFRQEMLHTCDCLIVSYDLVHEVRQQGWDAIVVDEMHEMVSYRSKTAQRMRALFADNPPAHKFGLSATLLTANPKNAWTLLNLYEPDKWGQALKTGEPPWWFVKSFCNEVVKEWEGGRGISYTGIKEESKERFAAIIASKGPRILRKDVAHLLPPIELHPLVVPSSDKKGQAEHALDWARTAILESNHVAIFTHYRRSAAAIANLVASDKSFADCEIACIDGEVSPDRRKAILERCANSPKSIVISTMRALATGINGLVYVQQYLVAELVATPLELVQLLGRFSRLTKGSGGALGKILFREGVDDERGHQLKQRLRDNIDVQGEGSNDTSLLSAASSFSSQTFDSWVDSMAATFRDYAGIDDEDDSL